MISFNYDTITEAAIESGSGLRGRYPESMNLPPDPGREIPEDEIVFSHYNWNRPLGYGIRFDRVQLRRAGISTYVDGRRFYSNKANKLYDWELLKLHGSLNWFSFLPFRSFPSIEDNDEVQPKWMKSAVIHLEGHWWLNRPPDFEGWFIDPLLITPVLDKEQLFNDPLYTRVFTPLWNRAKEALSACKRLVIIGYSFSPTDFRTKKLFLEAFATNDLKELIIVSRNQTVVDRAKDLCHFKDPLVFTDLTSYVKRVNHIQARLSPVLSADELNAKFQEGKRIVEALDAAVIDLTGAFWFLLPPPVGWRLFLVSSIVDIQGTEDATMKVQAICSATQPPITMGTETFMVVSPTNSLPTIMKRIIRTGRGIAGIRVTGSVVDSLPIEDAYIYRMV
jgi:hypothetical protein